MKRIFTQYSGLKREIYILFVGNLVTAMGSFVWPMLTFLLTTKLGWSFWPALLAGGCFTALIGFLLGLPTLRLSGTYLSIVTLGFCEIVQMILKQWESVTNGNYGIRNIPKPELFGFEFKLQNGGFYFIILVLVTLTALGCMAIKKSKSGRAFLAIKDDELCLMVLCLTH